MIISGGDKNCPNCGRPNELKQVFTSYAYVECKYCSPSKSKGKNNTYKIYCIMLDNDIDKKCVIALKKPIDDIEDFVTVTHSNEETEDVIKKVYKKYGGKGDPFDSQEWDTEFKDANGHARTTQTSGGSTTQTLEFEGD